jgi:hypothetical protein
MAVDRLAGEAEVSDYNMSSAALVRLLRFSIGYQAFGMNRRRLGGMPVLGGSQAARVLASFTLNPANVVLPFRAAPAIWRRSLTMQPQLFALRISHTRVHIEKADCDFSARVPDDRCWAAVRPAFGADSLAPTLSSVHGRGTPHARRRQIAPH